MRELRWRPGIPLYRISGKGASRWLFRAPLRRRIRGPASHILDAAAARPPYPPVPVPFTDQAPWARVIRHARCADSSLDPDQWFPVSVETDKARREAATAIAVCTACLVRAQCPGVLAAALGYRPAWRCLGRPGRRRTRGIAPPEAPEHNPLGHVVVLTDGAGPEVAVHSSPGADRETVGGARTRHHSGRRDRSP